MRKRKSKAAIILATDPDTGHTTRLWLAPSDVTEARQISDALVAGGCGFHVQALRLPRRLRASGLAILRQPRG